MLTLSRMPYRLEGRNYNDTFSLVLGPGSSQHQVFQAVGLPLADATLRGQNTCLFAYGQSGAGKTFSMYGAEGGKNPSKLDGVVPATVSELFRRTIGQEKDAGEDKSCRISRI